MKRVSLVPRPGYEARSVCEAECISIEKVQGWVGLTSVVWIHQRKSLCCKAAYTKAGNSERILTIEGS